MADDPITAALTPIRDRERKASPGPWKVRREHGYDMDGDPWSLPSVTADGEDILLGFVDQTVADLRFAAHAREDVPCLLAAVEKALSFHEGCDEGYGRTRCSTCLDAYGDRAEWPCPTYSAVLAALTGKEADGDKPE